VVGVVAGLERVIASHAPRNRVLVAFDGPDAAGKTTLANHLAQTLSVPTLRASIDGFHRPQAERLSRGFDSPHGYYRDSFNHGALEDNLLIPFQSGASEVRTRVFDYTVDQEVHDDPTWVPDRCVLLFDGVFLLRPEICHWWDLAIYLHVPEEVTLERAKLRDAHLFGSSEAVEARYRARYLPGQALYRDEAKPQHAAHIVLDHSDPAAPVALKWDVPS
jgi:uridine kinase